MEQYLYLWFFSQSINVQKLVIYQRHWNMDNYELLGSSLFKMWFSPQYFYFLSKKEIFFTLIYHPPNFCPLSARILGPKADILCYCQIVNENQLLVKKITFWAIYEVVQWFRICVQCRRNQVYPCIRKISWRSKWQPTPVFLLRKSHGQRSLIGYSPRGQKVARDWQTEQQ